MRRVLIQAVLLTAMLTGCRSTHTSTSATIRQNDSVSISRYSTQDIRSEILSGTEVTLDSALIIIHDYPDGRRRTIISTPQIHGKTNVTKNEAIRGETLEAAQEANSTEITSQEKKEKESHGRNAVPLWLSIGFFAGIILLLSLTGYRLRK